MDNIVIRLIGQCGRTEVFDKYVGPFKDEEKAVDWLMSNGFTRVDRGRFYCEGSHYFHSGLIKSSLAKQVSAKFIHCHAPYSVKISPEERVTSV